MGRMARLNAAAQMERDDIRSLTRKQKARTLCGHVESPGNPIVVRCHKHAGYSVRGQFRCFTHAILNVTKGD